MDTKLFGGFTYSQARISCTTRCLCCQSCDSVHREDSGTAVIAFGQRQASEFSALTPIRFLSPTRAQQLLRISPPPPDPSSRIASCAC